MTELGELPDAVTHVLSALAPVVERARIRGWAPEREGVMPLLLRAVLIRQHELLTTILRLHEDERGYAGVVLLRPGVEELIWCKYLSQIDSSMANRLSSLITMLEVHDSLRAELDFSGKGAIQALGLLQHLERSTEREPLVRDEIRSLGRALAWKARVVEQGTLPSLDFLATRTSLKKEYNYLYHATSRFVHFSTSELLRRAWGTRDKVSISSETFSSYWGAFALKWGIWVYSHTYLVLQPRLEEDGIEDSEVEGHDIIEAFKRIADFGHVPVITSSELRGAGF